MDIIEHRKLIGAQIRMIRKNFGISQTDLAPQVGLKPNTISSIENGRMTTTTDNLYLLAKALRCSPKDFFPDKPKIRLPNVERN